MSDQAPEGYRWEWLPEDDSWRIGGNGRKCRMMGCRKQAVAMLRRKSSRNVEGIWWPYCTDHLYGRKIENGVILSERLVKIEEVTA